MRVIFLAVFRHRRSSIISAAFVHRCDGLLVVYLDYVPNASCFDTCAAVVLRCRLLHSEIHKGPCDASIAGNNGK